MKVLLGLFLIFASSQAIRQFRRGRALGGNLGEPKGDNFRVENVETLWHTQNLDHFNPADTRIWKQRFYVNDEYFTAPDSPVFLEIGGEGEASIKWMTAGAWIDSAKKYRALLFQLEHRYYGESHPTDDLSTDNLQYLSSEQALADLGHFITTMNQKYNLTEANKWIVFGGSYPGNLAAWMRAKYPHLVAGAMSASGPVLAQTDFSEYMHVVRDSLATHSDECVEAVQEGSTQIQYLLKEGGNDGRKLIDELFHTCDSIVGKDENDIANFMEILADNFAGVVQYNKDNRIGGGGGITIDDVCDIMVNKSLGSYVHRLANLNSVLYGNEPEDCVDYGYKDMVEFMQEVEWDSPVAEGSRQWVYQTCTEFGYYQTSTYAPHTFGTSFPIDFFLKQCADIYGDKFRSSDFVDGAVNRTNTFFGGLNLKVSNVVYVHGSIDPWHALGITETRDPEAPAIYIKGTAHCANMYPPSEDDLPELTAAREKVDQLIREWLKG